MTKDQLKGLYALVFTGKVCPLAFQFPRANSGREVAPSVEDRAMEGIGSDGMHPSVLREMFPAAARPPLSTLTHHRSRGRFCMIANKKITHCFKKYGGKYCPVSFTSVHKVMKQILKAIPTLSGACIIWRPLPTYWSGITY